MIAPVNPTDPHSSRPLPDRTPPAPPSGVAALAQRIDALLPQTQCTRCGYPDCRSYAEAIAVGDADLNQCPPGGARGVARLAELLDRPARPLNPAHGVEGPRLVVFIDEATCIGCTLCIQACPVDAIIGAPKRMHAVVEADCTGCERCLPVCPVDCIMTQNASGAAAGWDAWSAAQAEGARTRYSRRQARVARESAAAAKQAGMSAMTPAAVVTDAAAAEPVVAAAPYSASSTLAPDARRDAIQAALARARLRARMRPDE